MFWVKQGFQGFLSAINRFFTLKNMGANTKFLFLSTLESDFANFYGGHFENDVTQVVHHESNKSHRSL